MSNIKSLATIAAIALSAAAAPLFSQTLTGPEVMSKYFHNPKPKTSIMNMSMVITKNGKSLSRSMSNWGSGDNAKGEAERKLVKFLAPGDIKGSGFLSVKKVDGSTESQLWLPAMGKVRRLSSGRLGPGPGLLRVGLHQPRHQRLHRGRVRLHTEGLGRGRLHRRGQAEVGHGYELLVYQIDAKTFTAKRIDYHRGGKLIKSQTIATVTMDGYTLPSTIVMTSASGSSTTIHISEQKVDQDLGDKIFTERFLKQ